MKHIPWVLKGYNLESQLCYLCFWNVSSQISYFSKHMTAQKKGHSPGCMTAIAAFPVLRLQELPEIETVSPKDNSNANVAYISNAFSLRIQELLQTRGQDGEGIAELLVYDKIKMFPLHCSIQFQKLICYKSLEMKF